MSGVETRRVSADEGEVRLDRWFRRHFPELGHGRLQKLLRTGQVRVDGRRAQANARLSPGQAIRIPPLSADEPSPASPRPTPGKIDPSDAAWLRSRVMYEDRALIVLDKPAGLAVQGGTGTRRHLDGMLQTWAAGGERPRLVHRLDRDTSGLLVVAKTAAAAAKMTEAFRRQRVEKLYWALVLGRPPETEGSIDQPLAKQPGKGGERVGARAGGLPARTLYRVVARAGKVASWLALKPLTGRTHQLRVHCAELGAPIIGDGKYGGARAHPEGAPKGLMLHAREIRLPHPDGGVLALSAPLSDPVLAGFRWLGFEPDPSLPGARLVDFAPP
jgi:23S rRNA pseudouridine955/2504/2580 synthase